MPAPGGRRAGKTKVVSGSTSQSPMEAGTLIVGSFRSLLGGRERRQKVGNIQDRATSDDRRPDGGAQGAHRRDKRSRQQAEGQRKEQAAARQAGRLAKVPWRRDVRLFGAQRVKGYWCATRRPVTWSSPCLTPSAASTACRSSTPRKKGGQGQGFLAGRPGQRKGAFLIGNPDRVLLAEGYATAASLHEATGLPVAVAFDAGNLMPVAQTAKYKAGQESWSAPTMIISPMAILAFRMPEYRPGCRWICRFGRTSQKIAPTTRRANRFQ